MNMVERISDKTARRWSNRRGEGAARKWILAHVNYVGDECLTWPFCLVNGYGVFGHCGETFYAHRVMCELANGPMPDDAFYDAAHSCGRGDQACINPNHLLWKTRSDNQKDRAVHGTRNNWGARGKISPKDADQIRALKGKMKQREVAEIFGISRAQVSSIQTGRCRSKKLKGYYKSGNRYSARVILNGRHINLGSFDTRDEASCAYLAANEQIRAGTFRSFTKAE
jgi:predicted XRE-type DNA-binding protein